MEDNITSADPPSYTTTIMIPGRPGKLNECLLTWSARWSARWSRPERRRRALIKAAAKPGQRTLHDYYQYDKLDCEVNLSIMRKRFEG